MNPVLKNGCSTENMANESFCKIETMYLVGNTHGANEKQLAVKGILLYLRGLG